MATNDQHLGPFKQEGISRLFGFDSNLPEYVREELLSGKLTEVSEQVAQFLREIDGGVRVVVSVNRPLGAIHYTVRLKENGDAAVDMASGERVMFADEIVIPGR